MNEITAFLLVALAGMALGVFFFLGLWWTVKKMVSSTVPALLFFASLMVRISITLVGFYFVGHADWQRLLACLFGFIVARFVVIRITSAREVSHAS